MEKIEGVLFYTLGLAGFVVISIQPPPTAAGAEGRNHLLSHYAFEQEVPLRYDDHLDGFRYLEPVPPRTPVLIIHGQNDELVPIGSSRNYAASYPHKTQLIEIDSDHRLNDQLDLILKTGQSFLLD